MTAPAGPHDQQPGDVDSTAPTDVMVEAALQARLTDARRVTVLAGPRVHRLGRQEGVRDTTGLTLTRC